jgi:hypothetical protein
LHSGHVPSPPSPAFLLRWPHFCGLGRERLGRARLLCRERVDAPPPSLAWTACTRSRCVRWRPARLPGALHACHRAQTTTTTTTPSPAAPLRRRRLAIDLSLELPVIATALPKQMAGLLSACGNLGTWTFLFENSRRLRMTFCSWCDAVSDLSPLAALVNLQSLDMSCCNTVSYLAPLATMVNLHSLKIISCTVSDTPHGHGEADHWRPPPLVGARRRGRARTARPGASPRPRPRRHRSERRSVETERRVRQRIEGHRATRTRTRIIPVVRRARTRSMRVMMMMRMRTRTRSTRVVTRSSRTPPTGRATALGGYGEGYYEEYEGYEIIVRLRDRTSGDGLQRRVV